MGFVGWWNLVVVCFVNRLAAAKTCRKDASPWTWRLLGAVGEGRRQLLSGFRQVFYVGEERGDRERHVLKSAVAPEQNCGSSSDRVQGLNELPLPCRAGRVRDRRVLLLPILHQLCRWLRVCLQSGVPAERRRLRLRRWVLWYRWLSLTKHNSGRKKCCQSSSQGFAGISLIRESVTVCLLCW